MKFSGSLLLDRRDNEQLGIFKKYNFEHFIFLFSFIKTHTLNIFHYIFYVYKNKKPQKTKFSVARLLIQVF